MKYNILKYKDIILFIDHILYIKAFDGTYVHSIIVMADGREITTVETLDEWVDIFRKLEK